MDPSRVEGCRFLSHRARVWFPLGLLVLLAGGRTALSQVPPGCPHVCKQEYALCIAASCDASGSCGACDKTDGSCGSCYVFKGESCSYGESCDKLQPSGDKVYSTYSERLSSEFGFKVLSCPNATSTANCMDGPCTRTGKTVTLTDKHGRKHQVPTAVCQCRITQGGGSTLGGQCTQANCSAIWSVAGGGLLAKLPQCAAAQPAYH